MMSTRNTVERAFELARSGSVKTMDELRRALKEEGCDAVEAHLGGSAIRKQLRQILDVAAIQPAMPKL